MKAVAVDQDGNVYVGGDFTSVGDDPSIRYIARWNAVDGWLALGSDVNGTVKAIAVAPNGDVYAGGEFTRTGDVSANRIAHWDGSGWFVLGSGLDGTVNAIAVAPNGDVYVGGKFTTAGGVTANGIARWSKNSWHDVGGGVSDVFIIGPGSVNAIAVDGTDVYVGGNFAYAGDESANYVARWNSVNGGWEGLDSPAEYQVVALATNGRELYVASMADLNGGFRFYQVSDMASTTPTWTELVSDTLTSRRVYAVAASQKDVFVGGQFTTESMRSRSIARWNRRNRTWGAMGNGVGGGRAAVHALALAGPAMYVGGDFTTAGGQTANRIARWVQAIADLSVFQRVSPPDQVYAGEQITYEIAVQHNGYHEAGNVTLTDTLPADVPLGSASAPYDYDPETRTITWTIGDLARGTRVSRSMVANVPATTITGTALVNRASVTADQYDPVVEIAGSVGNFNTHVMTTVIHAEANLLLEKRAPAIFDLDGGGKLTYTLTVTNTGPSAASDVVLTDTLPDVSFTEASPDCTWQGGATVTCELGTMQPSGPDSVKTVEIVVGSRNLGTLTNRARVSALHAEPQEATATTVVTGTAGLTINKTDGVDIIGLNEPLTYTITAGAYGEYQITGVRIIDSLPTSVTLRSVSASQGSCTGTTTIDCQPGTLDPGNPVAVTLSLTPTAEGRLSNTSQVSGDGVSTVSSTDDDTWVRDWADLSLAMEDAPDPTAAGQSLVYTLIVVNSGPAATHGVVLTDDLPDGLYLNSTATTHGTCTPGPDPASALVRCDIGALGKGESATVALNVTPLSPGTGTFHNTATVASAKYDPDLDNNQADAETRVEGRPQTRALNGLSITAYAFFDLGGGQTRAYGVVSLGDHFRLSGLNDYVTFDDDSLTAAGTLVLKQGDLPIFEGDFSGSAPGWGLTLGSGASVVPHVAGFALEDSSLTGVSLRTGEVTGSTTGLRLEPPGNSLVVSANFAILPGPVFSGTIRDAFSLAASAFALTVPAGATLSNDGISAEHIDLVMPYYFGSGVVPDAELLVKPDSLRLLGMIGAGFSMPDLRFNRQDTLVIRNAEGVLTRKGDAYTIVMRNGELHIALPGNALVVPLGEVRLDSAGQIEVETLPSFTLKVAGATLTVDQAKLENPGLEVSYAILKLPANLGGEDTTVPDVRITPASELTLAGGGGIHLPDIEILGGETLRVNGPVVTLVQETDGYSFDVQSGAVQVMLSQQNDHRLGLASGRVDVDGHFAGQLQQDTLALTVAGAQLTLRGLATGQPLDDETGLSVAQGTWQLPGKLGGGSTSLEVPILVDDDGLHINDGNPVPFPDAALHEEGYPLRDNQASVVKAADRSYKLHVTGTVAVTIPGASDTTSADLWLNSQGNFNGTTGALDLLVGGLTLHADTWQVENGQLLSRQASFKAPDVFGGDVKPLQHVVTLDKPTGHGVGAGRACTNREGRRRRRAGPRARPQAAGFHLPRFQHPRRRRQRRAGGPSACRRAGRRL